MEVNNYAHKAKHITFERKLLFSEPERLIPPDISI